jgi:hypothetical protein
MKSTWSSGTGTTTAGDFYQTPSNLLIPSGNPGVKVFTSSIFKLNNAGALGTTPLSVAQGDIIQVRTNGGSTDHPGDTNVVLYFT